MAMALDKDLERDQVPVPTLNALAPLLEAPTSHPPVIVPADAFPGLANNPPVLGFAPAPAVPAEPAASPQPAVLTDLVPVLRIRPRGRLHLSGYEATIIALILGCGALCAYRLFWAISP